MPGCNYKLSKAFAKINTLRQEKYAKTWFIRILLNECYAILRKRNRETIYHEEISKEEMAQHEYSDLYQKLMELEIVQTPIGTLLSKSIYS